MVTVDGAVAAGYQFKQPGLYVYLSHNLIEAVLLGAAAHVNVRQQSHETNQKVGTYHFYGKC